VHLGDVVLFTTTVLAIVNPISSAVLFAAMAGRFAPGIQQRMANQSASAILVILLVCAWVGRPLLQILGISVPMLQAAGGLILLLYGIRMVTVDELKLTPAEQVSAEEVAEEHWKTLAVVPLAISRHRRRRHDHDRGHPGDDVFELEGSGHHHRRLHGDGAGDVADIPVRRTDRPPYRSDRAQYRHARDGDPG
jgi:MarC family integral membrane protein